MKGKAAGFHEINKMSDARTQIRDTYKKKIKKKVQPTKHQKNHSDKSHREIVS